MKTFIAWLENLESDVIQLYKNNPKATSSAIARKIRNTTAYNPGWFTVSNIIKNWKIDPSSITIPTPVDVPSTNWSAYVPQPKSLRATDVPNYYGREFTKGEHPPKGFQVRSPEEETNSWMSFLKKKNAY